MNAPILPATDRDVVVITVRLGADTNIARAGVGAISKVASSTSSGHQAALTVGAKYFRCREVDIELTLIEQGDLCAGKPARYTAAKKGGAS